MSKLLIIELLQSDDIAAPPSSVEKVMGIDEHIGCAMSGLIADARTLVEHARVETQVLSWVIYIFIHVIKLDPLI